MLSPTTRYTANPFIYAHTHPSPHLIVLSVASKRCDHISIQNNHVHDNGRNGLMLHRSCDHGTIKNNTAYDNGDAGLALYESSNVEIAGNTFYHNKCELTASFIPFLYVLCVAFASSLSIRPYINFIPTKTYDSIVGT